MKFWFYKKKVIWKDFVMSYRLYADFRKKVNLTFKRIGVLFLGSFIAILLPFVLVKSALQNANIPVNEITGIVAAIVAIFVVCETTAFALYIKIRKDIKW